MTYSELAQIASDENLWYHVDAAWGGAAMFVPELRSELEGIEHADSITFDAHKWLSVPMGAGIYMARHAIMDATFRVQTAYMPKDAESLEIVDPHLTSMQWSRRFTGLKVLLSLMVAGWDGYAAAIRHQTAMGEALRQRLVAEGWEIRNEAKLPVVCFTRDSLREDELLRICARVVNSGEAWISTTLLAGKEMVLRACITNYLTGAGARRCIGCRPWKGLARRNVNMVVQHVASADCSSYRWTCRSREEHDREIGRGEAWLRLYRYRRNVSRRGALGAAGRNPGD